jgi:TRAP-type C4-dicarboxylate transport system permease small subunit
VIATIVYASTNLLRVLHQLDQRSDALDIPAWIPQSFLTISLSVIALIIAVRTVFALLQCTNSQEDRR